MQHCSCIVFLDGDRNSSVHKPDVTVAEIALLRAVHGPDSVEGIKPTFVGKEKPLQELERLRFAYANSNVTKEGGSLIDAVYPGRSPNVPRTMGDIELDPSDADADEWEAPAGYPPVPDDPEPQEPADAPQSRNLGGRPRKEAHRLTE
jgi:hypothetical protein